MKKLVILIAWLFGAAAALAPAAFAAGAWPADSIPSIGNDVVLLVRAGGSVLIHAEAGGHKPLNWMPPASAAF
jgi:Endonuclease NucS N-terminal PH-like domain